MNRHRQEDVRSLIQGVFRSEHKTDALVLQTLRQHWARVVGPELSERCWPQRLQKDTLWIAATDACWAYELQFHKRRLLGSVQAFLESNSVRELRFSADPVGAAEIQAVLGSAPALLPASTEVGEVVEEAELERTAGGIADPELRRTFLSAMRRIRAKNPPPGSR